MAAIQPNSTAAVPEISTKGISIAATSAPTHSGRKRQQFWLVGGVLLAFGAIILALCFYSLGPVWLARWNYKPQEGDIIFQSLSASPIVEAIEGATHSPFSHCGIVAQNKAGEWIVYEAYHDVESTPLQTFLARGRNAGFAVYRLKAAEQSHVPTMVKYAHDQLGKKYDRHYDMDDKEIYCSELIYKGYGVATGGQPLGQVVTFGELNWKPFEKLVLEIEEVVPVDREMITPRDLAKAEQLELVTHYAIEVR